MIIYILDANKNIQFALSSDCGISGIESSLCSKYLQIKHGTSFDKKTLIINETVTNSSITFRYLAFTYVRASSSTTNISLTNISINNIYNLGNNTLPTATINKLNISCFNATSNKYVKFNIDSNDIDWDIIYYALDNKTLFSQNVLYKEDFAKTQNGQCVFDDSFFNLPYISNNNTYLTPSFLQLFADYQILGESGLSLFNNVCGGQIQLLPTMTPFYLKSPLNYNANYSQRIEFIIKENSNLTLTFYNHLDSAFKTLVFHHDSSNLTIRDNGTIVFNKAYNNQQITFELFEFYNNFAQYQVNSLAWSISEYTSPHFTYDSYKQVKFSVDSSNQNNIIIGYLNLVSTDSAIVPNWQLTKPNNISYNYIGSNFIKLYITDNVHITLNEYNTITKDFNVLACDLVTQSTEETQNYKDAFNSVKGGLSNICNSLDNGLPNTNGWVCKTFNIISLAIAMILGFIILSIVFDWFGFLLTFGLSGIVTALILPISNTLVYIYGFSMVLGIVLLIMKLFSGQSDYNGGVNNG
jgi:hypothetical protein